MKYLSFIGFFYWMINYTETKLNFVVYFEFFSTMFEIVIMFYKYVRFVYNYIYVFSQMFFYKSTF